MAKRKVSELEGGASCGRPEIDLQTTNVKKLSAFRLRELFGLEKPRFKYAKWNPSQPITFLTCGTVFFLCTRLLMDTFKDAAIEWKEVNLTFEWG